MSKRKPTTSGTEWLYLSMASFNGSGYADKVTPENYVASYRAYKTWRKDYKAVELVGRNPDIAYEFAVQLCQAKDAGHTPSHKNYLKFRRFYNPDNVELL